MLESRNGGKKLLLERSLLVWNWCLLVFSHLKGPVSCTSNVDRYWLANRPSWDKLMAGRLTRSLACRHYSSSWDCFAFACLGRPSEWVRQPAPGLSEGYDRLSRSEAGKARGACSSLRQVRIILQLQIAPSTRCCYYFFIHSRAYIIMTIQMTPVKEKCQGQEGELSSDNSNLLQVNVEIRFQIAPPSLY